MAKLYFYYGAMGSSKTAGALITEFNYNQRGYNPLLAKSEADKRDGANVLQSRIGLKSSCITVKKLQTYSDEHIEEYDVIIVDEAQFCTEEQIDFLSDIVDKLNIPVICYGLRSDFQNRFFPGAKRLMEIADKLVEVKTMCWCGRKATCNARYNKKGIVRDGKQLMLGSDAKYIAVCRKHFKSGNIFGPDEDEVYDVDGFGDPWDDDEDDDL